MVGAHLPEAAHVLDELPPVGRELPRVGAARGVDLRGDSKSGHGMPHMMRRPVA